MVVVDGVGRGAALVVGGGALVEEEEVEARVALQTQQPGEERTSAPRTTLLVAQVRDRYILVVKRRDPYVPHPH